jgi:hypothetical protein
MLIQVSNTFGLRFRLEPFSWIYQLRFQHVQSSTKSTAKQGNAYAFLQHGSFHVRKSYPAWIKALLSTALTHSSDHSRWSKQCQLLFTKLRERGFSTTFLFAEFSKKSWDDRSKALAPKIKVDVPFDNRCVWSCENAPGLQELFRTCELNLSEIDAKIFPTRLSTVTKGTKRLSAYLKK